MSTNNKIENNQSSALKTRGFGRKLMFFMLGGGIGAAIALLFAPKSGKELRQDIAATAAKGYDETLDAANRVKEQSMEYYEAAKDKGGEVLDLLAEKASAVKDEIVQDAGKISGMAGAAAKRVTESVRPRQIL
ncbi:MAG: YtxH domain-containing protein [Chloracidobacterium sp.]|nr:YtxH domain-containing protein [Chloracidobacterium sp.]